MNDTILILIHRSVMYLQQGITRMYEERKRKGEEEGMLGSTKAEEE